MKISVIVPVYNAEKFLNKCIESVEKQTYTNWELLLIDDGSSDKSAEIMKAACERDSRIKEFHQINVGPGITRNRGINLATGDYIVFLDADDYIDSEYFLLLSLEDGKDVVFIDVNQVANNGKILKKEFMSDHKKWNKNRIIRAQMTGKISWGGWRKAVKRNLLIENHIQFTEHDIGEEALYSFCVLDKADSIGFIEKPVYFYVNHENSQSKLNIDDPWGPAVERMKEYLLKSNLYEKYADTLNAFNITATIVSLDKIQQIYSNKQRENKAIERLDKFKKNYDKKAGIDNINILMKAKLFEWFIMHNMYKPIFFFSNLREKLKRIGNEISNTGSDIKLCRIL